MTDNDGLHKRRGVWYYRLRIDGRWKELSTHTRNYQEARRVRQEATELHTKGHLPTDLARAPFDRVSEEWLAARKLTVAARTYESDKIRLKFVQRSFGSRRLEELVANGGTIIRSFQLNRSAKVGPRTVNMELSVIRLILKQARLWRRVEDDVKPLREPSRGPGRALGPEEEAKLWSVAASRDEWKVAYWAGLVAANTTMRKCELRGLTLADVDLTGGSLRIRRAATKTDAGARLIPLNPTAKWALGELVGRAKAKGAGQPSHYVFPYRVLGCVYDPARAQVNWRSAWRSLTRAAGFKGLRVHDLRHLAITKLAEAGVPDHVLMSISGHIDRRMIEYYSHVRTKARVDAVNCLNTPLPTPLPTTEETAEVAPATASIQ
jgi:integrase